MARGNGTLTWQLAFALWLIVFSTQTAHSQCEPVIDPAISVEPAGAIRVNWGHPPCSPPPTNDTIVKYSGTLTHPFYVQGQESEEIVAVPLPDLPPGATVRAVRTYVLGSAEASQDDWREKADLWCSLHWESNGYPGQQIGYSRHWTLGDHDSLFGGGWYRDTTGWGLDISDTSTLWLAIHWLPGTASIVRLGADGLTAPRAYVAGVGADPVWNTIWSPGLLIETDIEYPTAVNPEVLAQTVRVVRQAWKDTGDTSVAVLGVVPVCGEVVTDDDPPAASWVRYGLVSSCDTVDSDTAWTATLETPADVSAAVVPGYLSLVLQTGEREALSLELVSTDPDSLYMSISQVDTVNWRSGPNVSIVPKEATLEPGGVLSCTLHVDASGIEAGFYSTVLGFDVRDLRTGGERAFEVLFEVIVDQQTDVADIGFDGDRSGAWGIRPTQNPFSGPLTIEIVPLTPLTGGESGASTPIELNREIEVAVYDILGRVVSRPRLGTTSLGSMGMHPTIRIEDSTTWPSGVYICRVQIGSMVRSMKLVHLK